ncbi:hypothetical protein CPB83DRAFT_855034, partial [Crepidotus variabilis]
TKLTCYVAKLALFYLAFVGGGGRELDSSVFIPTTSVVGMFIVHRGLYLWVWMFKGIRFVLTTSSSMSR